MFKFKNEILFGFWEIGKNASTGWNVYWGESEKRHENGTRVDFKNITKIEKRQKTAPIMGRMVNNCSFSMKEIHRV